MFRFKKTRSGWEVTIDFYRLAKAIVILTGIYLTLYPLFS